MKKFLTIFAVAALALTAVVSCSKDKEDEETTVELKGISLSSSSLDLFVGDENTLTVKYTPENATEKPKATWTSSNAEVASVSEGKVTALAAGETTITAKVLTFTATCTVKVSAKDDYTGPVEGTSEWSVVGTLLESGWGSGAHGDYVCAEDNGAFVLKNVRLAENDELKFRKDKAWDVNRGVAAIELGVPVKAEQDGGNIKLGQAGLFDLYYFAEKEAIVIVAKDGTLPEIPDFSEKPDPTDLAIDGYFHEWETVTAVAGDGALKAMKLLVDETNVYIYLETDKTKMFSDNLAFAHKVMLCFDNGDWDGAKGSEAWNEAKYDKVIDPWLMQNGEPNMITWGLAGFKHAEAVDGDVQKYEFCFEKSVDALFSGEGFRYGAFINNQKCDNSSGSEVWSGESDTRIGSAPAVDQEMAVYGKVSEKPEPADEWDYTPSAEYTAQDNLWKAVDAANRITWFYNPNWAGELAAPETSFKESTYTIKLNEEDEAMEWTTQMKIHPTTDLVLDTQKKYTFTAKVYSSTGTHVFFKMYQDGVDWPESFETPAGANRIAITAGETKEIKVEDFIPLGTPQILLIDFAQHGANNTIHVKDITLKVTGEVEQPVEWDYTPSEEYTASNNLWKPVFDANGEKYYYYHCTGADYNGTDILDTTVPFLTKTQSTYELNYEAETSSTWQNQFFVFPDAGKEIALKADKTYNLKVTLGTNQSIAPGFFKFSKADPANAKGEGAVIWEKGAVSIEGATPLVIEHEFTGVECDNIILVMDFGGNPANTKIYIKDIILTEVGAEPQPTVLTVTEFAALAKGAEDTFSGIVAATAKDGIVVTDGTTNLYVYKGTAAVGDKVTMKATKDVYYNLHQAKNATITVDSQNNEVPATAAVDITATFDTYPDAEHTSDLVQFVGTIAISGNFININVDGASTHVGSVKGGIDMSSLDGKKGKVSGYYVGTSKSGNTIYINLAVTAFEEIAPEGSGGENLNDPIDTNPWK